MKHAQTPLPSFDSIFSPRSVAVVGVPRGLKMGKLFLIALLEQGFPGPIYPVHPTAKAIDGIKAYPSISAVPDPVDLAIILVPHHQALPVVKQCGEKGVKAAVLFTAGYKETGTAKGRHLENELARTARSAGMRLFGPNCMGLYCPKSGLSFFPQLSTEPGSVAFVSHSGSLANILGHVAGEQGIRFSKAVSLGNECDVATWEMLEYLADDPDTRVIGAYIEGIKEGQRFAAALKKASSRKPVLLWKVGLTAEGGRAASSHTGAMAGSRTIWEAVVRQGRAVSVVGIEELMDGLMGFSMLPERLGDRMAILSGPGGLAVSAAEAVGNAGLKLAELSADTRAELAKFVPPTGTSLMNPVDVGLSASIEMEIYVRAARALAADPGVDAVVVAGAGLSPDTNRVYTDSMIQARTDYGKPFVMVNIPGFDRQYAREMLDAGLPFFESAERAMNVYGKVRDYQIRKR